MPPPRLHPQGQTVIILALSTYQQTHVLWAGSEYSYVGVYGKWGQPPGWSYGQSDFRSNGGYFPGNQLAYELKFDASMPGFQTGEPQLSAEGSQMCKGQGC